MEPHDNNFTQDNQSNSDDNFRKDSLSNQATRCTYLIRYSQTDKSKFPARERFANEIVDALNEAEDKVYVEHWACCLELHRKGSEHFHLCVKLSGPSKWKRLNRLLATNMVSFCTSLANMTITMLSLNMLSKLTKNYF